MSVLLEIILFTVFYVGTLALAALQALFLFANGMSSVDDPRAGSWYWPVLLFAPSIFLALWLVGWIGGFALLSCRRKNTADTAGPT